MCCVFTGEYGLCPRALMPGNGAVDFDSTRRRREREHECTSLSIVYLPRICVSKEKVMPVAWLPLDATPRRTWSAWFRRLFHRQWTGSDHGSRVIGVDLPCI